MGLLQNYSIMITDLKVLIDNEFRVNSTQIDCQQLLTTVWC